MVRRSDSPRFGFAMGSQALGTTCRGNALSSMPRSATTRKGTERIGSSAHSVIDPPKTRSPRCGRSNAPESSAATACGE